MTTSIAEEQARWLARLEVERAQVISDAVAVLETLRLSGRSAEIRIETRSRADFVSGETGLVDIRRFGESQTDFYFAVPEGPPKEETNGRTQ